VTELRATVGKCQNKGKMNPETCKAMVPMHEIQVKQKRRAATSLSVAGLMMIISSSEVELERAHVDLYSECESRWKST
jgi:hypothetical protein